MAVGSGLSILGLIVGCYDVDKTPFPDTRNLGVTQWCQLLAGLQVELWFIFMIYIYLNSIDSQLVCIRAVVLRAQGGERKGGH